MLFDNAVTDRQAQPRSFCSFLRSEKGIKDPAQNFVLNPSPSILYGNSLDIPAFVHQASQTYDDSFVLMVAFVLPIQGITRICQQIHYDLLDLLSVTGYQGQTIIKMGITYDLILSHDRTDQ